MRKPDDGTFRKLFLRALAGEAAADANGDGYVIGTELGLHLSQRMANLTQNRQTPRYGKLRDADYDRGEFVFSVSRPAPRRAPAAMAPAPSAGNALELAFWQSIQDSDNPASFNAYLDRFPEGTFAPLARMKLKELAEAQTASLTPPATAIEIEEMDATYVVESTANLRAGPSTSHDKVALAQRESTVAVTGKVKGRNWYRIALADGTTAYVFGTLVSPVDPADLTLWERIRDSTDRKDFEAYLARFPDGRHAARAKRMIEALKPKVAVVTPRPAPAAAPSPVTPAVGVHPKARKPGDTFKDCEDCPDMVVVPPGRFQMGSPSHESGRDDDEEPVHEVRIGCSLAVGKHEVTRGQFGAFVLDTGNGAGGDCYVDKNVDGKWAKESTGSWKQPYFRQDDRHPVVCVNWKDAKAYVEWLSRKTGNTYRLLSASEWEYVARGGTTTARYWGNDADEGCGFANAADRTAKEKYSDWTVANCRDGHVHTAPVGSFRANGFGLQDVLGNVWEWMEDCWHDSYAGAPTDGSAWTSGGDCGRRVLRGGSWNNVPRIARSENRDWVDTGYRYNNIGFRVARTLP